jgi:hypothetical protein
MQNILKWIRPVVGPVPSTELKPLASPKIEEVLSRTTKCRPRFCLSSLDRKDIYYCPVFWVVVF